MADRKFVDPLFVAGIDLLRRTQQLRNIALCQIVILPQLPYALLPAFHVHHRNDCSTSEPEKRIKEKDALRDKQAAEQEYIDGKEKLDKALAMGVLEQADYDVKLAALAKKRDNFEIMRKPDQQVELGIITVEEKNAKLYEILN